MFDDLKSRPVDAEELALLYNIHSRDISGHLGRGYIILGTKTLIIIWRSCYISIRLIILRDRYF